MSDPNTSETVTSKNPLPGSTFLSRAKTAIEIINRQLAESGKITTKKGAADPRRVTLKHPHIPGILVSAFCRTNHTVVLIPVLVPSSESRKEITSPTPSSTSLPWAKPWP